jgi:hypothetical protein
MRTAYGPLVFMVSPWSSDLGRRKPAAIVSHPFLPSNKRAHRVIEVARSEIDENAFIRIASERKIGDCVRFRPGRAIHQRMWPRLWYNHSADRTFRRIDGTRLSGS